MGREKFDRLVDELMGHLPPTNAEAFRRGYERARGGDEPKPLPQIRGRREGGALWVRAEDVAAVLEAQAPVAAARLIKKLRG